MCWCLGGAVDLYFFVLPAWHDQGGLCLKVEVLLPPNTHLSLQHVQAGCGQRLIHVPALQPLHALEEGVGRYGLLSAVKENIHVHSEVL